MQPPDGHTDNIVYLFGFYTDEAEGEDMSATTATLSRLAVRYVAERHDGGHLNNRSAQQITSRLRDFCSTAPANPKALRRKHVERWMATPGLSPNYRRGRLSALRGFCLWLVSRGHIKRDPTLGVAAPPVPVGLPKRLRHDEARAVVAAAKRDPRALLVVLLMLQEGLRRAEIAALDTTDVDYAERTLLIRSKGGRGQHMDVLPISDETWRALMAYLESSGHQNGPLIRNRVRLHGRLSPHTISDIVRDVMIESGVKRPAGDLTRTPHSCRHTAAHDMMERTRDVRSVQQALRHRSVRSTEVYLRGQVGDLRQTMSGRSYLDGTELGDDHTELGEAA